MTDSKVTLVSLIAVIAAASALFYLAPSVEGNSLTSDNQVGCMERSAIIARGQVWVDKNVPYSQSKTYDGYRTDCSGFVSMCWQLPKDGPSTSEFPNYSLKITKNDLQPGDAMLCEGHHIVLFAGWKDSGKTQYVDM